MEGSALPGRGGQLGLFADTSAPPPGDAAGCLVHPRANRELALGAQCIRYELRRAQRRSIGFTVSGEGLSVTAPRWAGQAAIDAALQAKRDWILRKLAEQAQRRQQQARIEWRDGAALPYLGAQVRLQLAPGRRGVRLESATEQSLSGVLLVGLPVPFQGPQIREAVVRWLQQQARHLFEARLAHFAPRLGVQCARLSLSAARTRWGSASADGSIRLNWRLIHFPLETIDYVVAHELAHLREMNHSPRFWQVVGSVMPDYLQRRRALKSCQPPLLE